MFQFQIPNWGRPMAFPAKNWSRNDDGGFGIMGLSVTSLRVSGNVLSNTAENPQ